MVDKVSHTVIATPSTANISMTVVALTATRDSSKDIVGEPNKIDNNTIYNITDDTDVTLEILKTIYPVGSLYLTMNPTCPLTNLFGTWSLVGIKVITDVSSQATSPVVGDGKAVGWTDGTTNFGTMTGGNGLDSYTGCYGVTIGTNYSGTRITSDKAVGITTDPTKSGIVSDTSNVIQKSSLPINIFKRTA